MWRLRKRFILDSISNGMLWKGFIAGGMTKPESRNDIFDTFIGTFPDTSPDTVNGVGTQSSSGNIKKITAEEFNKLPAETKRKIYDDIVSKIKIPKMKMPDKK